MKRGRATVHSHGNSTLTYPEHGVEPPPIHGGIARGVGQAMVVPPTLHRAIDLERETGVEPHDWLVPVPSTIPPGSDEPIPDISPG